MIVDIIHQEEAPRCFLCKFIIKNFYGACYCGNNNNYKDPADPKEEVLPTDICKNYENYVVGNMREQIKDYKESFIYMQKEIDRLKKCIPINKNYEERIFSRMED